MVDRALTDITCLIDRLTVSKLGNALEDNQDAASHVELIPKAGLPISVAVSDGATESYCSNIWSPLLVSTYAKTGSLEKLFGELDNLAQSWLGQLPEMPKSLAWMNDAKVASGGHATLIGLNLLENSTWNAEAVGDSCLFHVRGDTMLCHFPLLEPSDFDTSPPLIASNMSKERKEALLEEALCFEGEWENGDIFLLATDALSCWLLKQENIAEDLQRLVQMSQEEFQEWAEQMVADQEIVNDDLTVLKIQINPQ